MGGHINFGVSFKEVVGTFSLIYD